MPPTQIVSGVSGVDEIREETRSYLAWIAMGSYFFILFFIIATWAYAGGTDEVIKLLTATGSLLSGIVGAIVGFYFRSEGSEK